MVLYSSGTGFVGRGYKDFNIFTYGNILEKKLGNADERKKAAKQTELDEKIRVGRNRDHLNELFDNKLTPGEKKTETREKFCKPFFPQPKLNPNSLHGIHATRCQ